MSEINYSAAQDDDVFQEWVASEEERKKKEEERKARGSYQRAEYENIKYVGVSREHPTIVRFVGNFVEEDLLAKRPYPSDAKFLHISKVKADDGKSVFFLQLPLMGDNIETDHLMWKIINRVYERQWLKDPATGKNKPVNVVKVQHPDIFELVDKGGYTQEDGKWPYLYAKGWRGTEMLLINCIDRRDNWCVENKHTKLLSKNVNITPDGTEFAEKGIPSYGFFNDLAKLRQNFQEGWEHYDVVITKTGEGKDTRLNLFNGTAMTAPASLQGKIDKGMGIPESEYVYISQNNALTSEELSYERYDLDKNFKVTSYHTINKYLSNSIKKIDGALNTHFYDELQQLVKEEQEKWDKERGENPPVATVETAPVAEQEVEAPKSVTRTVVQESVSTGLTPEKIALLKGYNELSEEDKSYIKDVIVKPDGTVDHIVWTETAPSLLDCPLDQGGCGQLSPNSFRICPVCGKHYE